MTYIVLKAPLNSNQPTKPLLIKDAVIAYLVKHMTYTYLLQTNNGMSYPPYWVAAFLMTSSDPSPNAVEHATLTACVEHHDQGSK